MFVALLEFSKKFIWFFLFFFFSAPYWRYYKTSPDRKSRDFARFSGAAGPHQGGPHTQHRSLHSHHSATVLMWAAHFAQASRHTKTGRRHSQSHTAPMPPCTQLYTGVRTQARKAGTATAPAQPPTSQAATEQQREEANRFAVVLPPVCLLYNALCLLCFYLCSWGVGVAVHNYLTSTMHCFSL